MNQNYIHMNSYYGSQFSRPSDHSNMDNQIGGSRHMNTNQHNTSPQSMMYNNGVNQHPSPRMYNEMNANLPHNLQHQSEDNQYNDNHGFLPNHSYNSPCNDHNMNQGLPIHNQQHQNEGRSNHQYHNSQHPYSQPYNSNNTNMMNANPNQGVSFMETQGLPNFRDGQGPSQHQHQNQGNLYLNMNQMQMNQMQMNQMQMNQMKMNQMQMNNNSSNSNINNSSSNNVNNNFNNNNFNNGMFMNQQQQYQQGPINNQNRGNGPWGGNFYPHNTMMNTKEVSPDHKLKRRNRSGYQRSYPEFSTRFNKKRRFEKGYIDISRTVSKGSSEEEQEGEKQHVENPTIICRCAKSRCLKLYCDCFRAEILCNTACKCIRCLNTETENKQGGRLKVAKRDYLLRKPESFGKKEKKLGDGCACKNNRYVYIRFRTVFPFFASK